MMLVISLNGRPVKGVCFMDVQTIQYATSLLGKDHYPNPVQNVEDYW
jgi:hypothetical protein